MHRKTSFCRRQTVLITVLFLIPQELMFARHFVSFKCRTIYKVFKKTQQYFNEYLKKKNTNLIIIKSFKYNL